MAAKLEDKLLLGHAEFKVIVAWQGGWETPVSLPKSEFPRRYAPSERTGTERARKFAVLGVGWARNGTVTDSDFYFTY
jgi:hypothetical protein